MQKWEYLTLTRSIDYVYKPGILPGIGDSGGFNYNWSDDNKMGWDARLKSIGDQGWELVQAFPVSIGLGDSGRTTSIYLIFKRSIES